MLLATAAVTDLANTQTALFAVRVALAASPLRAQLGGHEGEVRAAEWAPDGTRLATVGEDGSARVWDTRTGTELSAFEEHEAPVATVAWSPDGAWIATGSEDLTARVWDPATGSEHAVLRHDFLKEGIVSVAWSEDGRRVLTAPKAGKTAIWNLENGGGGTTQVGWVTRAG